MLPTAVALLYVGGKGGEQPGYGVPEDWQGRKAQFFRVIWNSILIGLCVRMP